jgi:hypothetical protein
MINYVSQNEGFAQLCPLCNGKGEIGKGKAKHDAYPIAKTKGGRYVFECHVCGGAGILKRDPIYTLPIQPNDSGDNGSTGGDNGKFWYNHKWVNGTNFQILSDNEVANNNEFFCLDDTPVGLPDSPRIRFKKGAKESLGINDAVKRNQEREQLWQDYRQNQQ